MIREIKKVAVLGAGVMGSGISAHIANSGIPCFLLDIVPTELNEEEKKVGLNDKKVRNRLSIKGIEYALKAKPSSFFSQHNSKLITPGNYEDNSNFISEADWIIEAVVEDLSIKQKLFEYVEKYRKPDSIVTSNTSGLPIKLMSEKMSDDMKRHFFVTHFFNPARYMRLLEIIKGQQTEPDAVNIIARFGEEKLGKGIVYGKDTPNFVGNRIGVHEVMVAMHLFKKYDLSLQTIDEILGPALGKPKSGVFRTTDIVGVDILIHVANTLYNNCLDDEDRDIFKIPDFLNRMIATKLLGEKTGSGFYKKTKDSNGKKEILSLNMKSFEYQPQQKTKYNSLNKIKGIDNLNEKIKTFLNEDDEASRFAWEVTESTLLYAAQRVPEISDDIVNIDRAMKWGFNNQAGPFELWDILGVKEVADRLEKQGKKIPPIVQDCLTHGNGRFYNHEGAKKLYFDISNKYKDVPVSNKVIYLENIKSDKKIVEHNNGATLLDIGNGVACLEFHTKLNAIDDDILQMIFKSIERVEKDFTGLIIANEHCRAFSAGANIMKIAMAIKEKNWNQIDESVKIFQKATSVLRYSKKPVVAAPSGLALGGGCEVSMGCDAIVAHGELYIGLVEMGVGLIPAGGGCLRLLLRNMDNPEAGGPMPFISKTFETIATAKVTTSSQEAYGYNFLRKRIDSYIMNRDFLIYEAKNKVIELAGNYKQPEPQDNIYLPGKDGRLVLEYGVENMNKAGLVTDYEVKIAQKLAYVLTGGQTNITQTITEQKILDLEREAFLSLCGEQNTLQRIEYMLMKNKPLRN